MKMKLLWDGSYKNSKDIMHFELRKAANSSDRPYQKAVHGINMEEIKGYLNSFNKKDGGKYAY